MKGTCLLPSALVLATIAGCTTGPVTVRRDRFNYNDAAAESTKEQLLINIVRLRYSEPICFIDITSMLSHYTLGAEAHASRYVSDLNVWNNPALRAIYNMRGEPVPGHTTWGGALNYEDSPTISYAPLTGEEFADRVMSPIPPTTIIHLSQSGWSIDRLLECCVQHINDLSNGPIHELRDAAPPDTAPFRRLSELLKKAQDAGYLRFSVEVDAGHDATYLYWPQRPRELEPDAAETKQLLGLPADVANKVKLTGHAVRTGPDEVAMQTRSLLATMYSLARDIDVPAEHVDKHQAASAPETDGPCTRQWLQVCHSRLPQIDPFVQVFYNGYWFYIDKSDWSSKRTFALLNYLFSLQSREKVQAGPLLTVPAGR